VQSEFIYNSELEKLDKYKPNQLSIYLLLGIFLALQVVFTLVHSLAIPKIPAKFDSYREERNKMMTSREDLEPVLISKCILHKFEVHSFILNIYKMHL